MSENTRIPDATDIWAQLFTAIESKSKVFKNLDGRLLSMRVIRNNEGLEMLQRYQFVIAEHIVSCPVCPVLEGHYTLWAIDPVNGFVCPVVSAEWLAANTKEVCPEM
jgi:hypothetical protein